MGRQEKHIEFGNDRNGIQVGYNKSKKMLHFFAWYDSIVGIKGGDISFDDFCKQLGIKNDISKPH